MSAEPPQLGESPDPGDALEPVAPAGGLRRASRADGIDPDVRFSYANERTFLAYNRTALALVTAGLAITQLLPEFDVPAGRRMIGLPLIALGTLISIASLYQWRINEQAMRRGLPLPKSVLPALVAVVVGVSSVVALALVIFGG